METGCALFAIVFVIAVSWWVVHIFLRHRRLDRDLQSRLGDLELEVSRLRREVAALTTTTDRRRATPEESPRPAARPLEQDAQADQGSESTRAQVPATWAAGEEPSSPPPASELQAVAESGDRGPEVEGQPPREEPQERPEPTPEPPARPKIEWEQWLGVRGLAVLAGMVLALAGLYFVRYSIEQGWIPPIVRVSLLFLAGITSVGVGERLRRTSHLFPAQALQGAGIVMLFAATWAARNLYDLVGDLVSFALFAMITVAGGVLAQRHRSLIIALLGLVGGFATPLLISSDSDRPLALFGYLLLLNVGVSFIAQRARWPFLGALGLLATVFYQASWILFDMQGRVGIAVLTLGVFVLFFLWSTSRTSRLSADRGEDELGHSALLQTATSAAALFVPFVFSLYFAAQSDLGESLLSVGALLLLLNLAALWFGSREGVPAFALGATAATLGTLAIWPIAREFSRQPTLEALVGLALLPGLHQLGLRLVRPDLYTDFDQGRAPQGAVLHRLTVPISGTAAAILIPFLHAVFWWEHHPSIWFLLAGLAVAAVLLLEAEFWNRAQRTESVAAASRPQPASLTEESSDTGSGSAGRQARGWSTANAALAAGSLGLFAIVSLTIAREAERVGPYGAPLDVVAVVLAVLAVQVLCIRWQASLVAPSRALERATALLPLAGLLGILFGTESALTATLGTLALALLLLVSSTRAADPFVQGAGLLGTAFVFSGLSLGWLERPHPDLTVLLLAVVACALFVAWPLLRRPPTGQSWPLGAWRVAALAPVAFAVAVLESWEQTVTGAWSAVPLLLLAAMAVVGLRLAPSRSEASAERTSVQAWFGAVALAFVAIAIPVQLDREWITVGWALLTVGLIALWRRVDHVGLKLFAVGLTVAVFVRLVLNPHVFGYYEPRAPWGLPVIGWLLYTYLLPAISLLVGARLLEPIEARRLRAWEPTAQAQRTTWATAVLGLSAIAIGFVWINLTIFDAFASGERVRIVLDRMPARDLTLSVAWAVYALLLLGAGVARSSRALRWVSLVVLFATIGKVFLYDLGELEDLYRVASLVGLAFSLLAVSMLYQRFVFSKNRMPPDELEPSETPDLRDEDSP